MGVNQGTTKPIYSAENLYGTGTRSKGSSSVAVMEALYPNSPVLNQEDTDTGATDFSLADPGGDRACGLRTGYQTVLDAAKASGAPNLADVTTPADQTEGEIVSPYMPNPATGQGSEGAAAVPSDRSGANGSITSPNSSIAAYSLTTVPDDAGTAATESE